MLKKVKNGSIYFDEKSILEALTNHFDPLRTKDFMFTVGTKGNGEVYGVATPTNRLMDDASGLEQDTPEAVLERNQYRKEI